MFVLSPCIRTKLGIQKMTNNSMAITGYFKDKKERASFCVFCVNILGNLKRSLNVESMFVDYIKTVRLGFNGKVNSMVN